MSPLYCVLGVLVQKQYVRSGFLVLYSLDVTQTSLITDQYGMLFINMQLAYTTNKQYLAEMSASKQLRQHLFEQNMQYILYPYFRENHFTKILGQLEFAYIPQGCTACRHQSAQLSIVPVKLAFQKPAGIFLLYSGIENMKQSV